MDYARTIVLAMCVGLAGCGGGGGGGSDGDGSSSGTVLSVSGSLNGTDVETHGFKTTQGHAYQLLLDADPAVWILGCGNDYAPGSSSCSPLYWPDFIAPESGTVYAWVFNPNSTNQSYSYSLKVYENHLAVGGSAISRKLDGSAYFSVDAVKDQAYEFSATPVSASDDLTFRLYSDYTTNYSGSDPSSEVVAVDAPAGSAARIAFIASETKTYYFEVDDDLDSMPTVSVAGVSASVVAAPATFNFEDGVVPATLFVSDDAWEIDTSNGGNGSTTSLRVADVGEGGSSCVTLLASNVSSIAFDWNIGAGTSDDLEFFVDEVYHSEISTDGWANVSTTVTTGTHTFRWCYARSYYAGTAGPEDVGWIDNLSIQ